MRTTLKRLRHVWFGLFTLSLAVASPHTSKALLLRAQDLGVLLGKAESSFKANPTQTFIQINGPLLQKEVQAYATLVEEYSFQADPTLDKFKDPAALSTFELTGHYFGLAGRVLALEARAHHRAHKHSGTAEDQTGLQSRFSDPKIRLSEQGAKLVILQLETSSARHILYRRVDNGLDPKNRIEFYFSEEQKQIVELAAMSQDPNRDVMKEYVELVRKHGYVDPTKMMSAVSFANPVHYAEYLQFHAIRSALINRWALSRMMPFEIKERPVTSCGKTFLFFEPAQVRRNQSPYIAELNQVAKYQDFTERAPKAIEALGELRLASDEEYGRWYVAGIRAAGYPEEAVKANDNLESRLSLGSNVQPDLNRVWNGDAANGILAGKTFIPLRMIFPGDSYELGAVAKRIAFITTDYLSLQSQFSVADGLMNGDKTLPASVRPKIIAAVKRTQASAIAAFQKSLEAKILVELQKDSSLQESTKTRSARLEKRVDELLPILTKLTPFAVERAKLRNRNKIKIGWNGGPSGGDAIVIKDAATLKLFYESKLATLHSGRKWNTIFESIGSTGGGSGFAPNMAVTPNSSINVGAAEEMRELLMNDPDIRKVIDTFLKSVEHDFNQISPRQSLPYFREYKDRVADYEAYVVALKKYEQNLAAYRKKTGKNIDDEALLKSQNGITLAEVLGRPPVDLSKPGTPMSFDPELLATITNRYAMGLRTQYPTNGANGGTTFNRAIEYALSTILNIPYKGIKENRAFLKNDDDRMLLSELQIAVAEKASSLLSVRWAPEAAHASMYEKPALQLLGAEGVGSFYTAIDKFGVNRIAETDEITLVEHIGLAAIDHRTADANPQQIRKLIRTALIHAGHSSQDLLEDFCEADPTRFSKDAKFAKLFKSSTKPRLLLGMGASLLNPGSAPNLPLQTKLDEEERVALEDFKKIDLTKYKTESVLTPAKQKILGALQSMPVPETDAYTYGFRPVALTVAQANALEWIKTPALEKLVTSADSPFTIEQARALGELQTLGLAKNKRQTATGQGYDEQLLAIGTLQRANFANLPKGKIPPTALAHLLQIQSIKLPTKQFKLSARGKTVVDFAGDAKDAILWVQTDTFRRLYQFRKIFSEKEEKTLSILRDIDLTDAHLNEIQRMDALLEKEVRTPVEAFTEDYLDPVMAAVMWVGIIMAVFWFGGLFAPAVAAFLPTVLGATGFVALNTLITTAIVANFLAIGTVSLIEHPPHYRYQAQVGNTQAGNTIDGAEVSNLMLWDIWQNKKDADHQKWVVQVIMTPLNLWMVSGNIKMIKNLIKAGRPLSEAQMQTLVDAELQRMADQQSPMMNLPKKEAGFTLVTAPKKVVETVVTKPAVLVENTIGASTSTNLQALRADLISELKSAQVFAQFQKEMPRYIDNALESVERDLVYFSKLGDPKNWTNGYLSAKDGPAGLLPRSANEAIANGQLADWAKQSVAELAPQYAKAAEEAQALADALRKLQKHLKVTLTGETQMHRAELTINVMGDDELMALRALFNREGALVYQVPSLSGSAKDQFNIFLEQMVRTTERSANLLPRLKLPANQTFKAYWGQPYNSLEGLTNDQRRYLEWLDGYLPSMSLR